MNTVWLFAVVAILILASIIYELATGETRLRGIGRVSRQKQPAVYWRSILLKLFVLVAVLVAGYLCSVQR